MVLARKRVVFLAFSVCSSAQITSGWTSSWSELRLRTLCVRHSRVADASQERLKGPLTSRGLLRAEGRRRRSRRSLMADAVVTSSARIGIRIPVAHLPRNHSLSANSRHRTLESPHRTLLQCLSAHSCPTPLVRGCTASVSRGNRPPSVGGVSRTSCSISPAIPAVIVVSRR